MKKTNKRMLSLVVAVMYALCLLVAAPVQASASTPGTHRVSTIYTAAQKAACKKAALIALAKLPSSTTTAKYYDSYNEFTTLKANYAKAYSAIYRAKYMGMNYKAFTNYYRLAIAKARIYTLTLAYNTYIKPLVNAVKALPVPVTLANKTAVAAAYAKYNALSATRKKLVPVPTKALLFAAVAKIAELKSAPAVSVSAITVTGADTVDSGHTLQLGATVAPSNATNKTVAWTVATLSVGTATINATGLLTATGAGTVTVTATNSASGVVGSKIITITDEKPVITNISISSNNVDPTKAMNGDIITLTFTSDELVTKLSNFKINGSNPDTFTNVGNIYKATHLVDAGDSITGVPATFQINVKNATGINSSTVEATTDSSSVTIITAPAIVTNEATLLEALANPLITTIKFANDITLATKTTADYLTIGRTVVIDGQNNALNKGMLIGASNVIVKNLTIKTSFFYNSEGADWYYGVMVNNFSGFAISNSTIAGIAYQDAVGISDIPGGADRDITVTNVSFSNLWTGVLTGSDSTLVTVTNSSFNFIKHGIYLEGAPLLNSITGNTFSNLVGTNLPDAINVPSATLTTVIDAMRTSNSFVDITYPADIRVR